MTVGAASGFPQQSGILIPEVWSGKLLTKFYKATVFGDIANTDYEGDISNMGDKVLIRTTPDIEIRDYKKGQTLKVQRPEPTKKELTIDYAKYWNAQIDNIDRFQSDINYVEDWSQDASQQMKIAQDRDILSKAYSHADAANTGANAGLESKSVNLGAPGAPLLLTPSNVVDFLVDVGLVLDEQNVPEDQRSIVLPNWVIALLKRSDIKNAYVTGDSVSPLRNGKVGQIDRLTLYGSNNVAGVPDSGGKTAYNAMATHKSALTYAAQLTENDIIKAESTFGWLARGLIVYGWEVIKPQAMVHAYIARG